MYDAIFVGATLDTSQSEFHEDLYGSATLTAGKTDHGWSFSTHLSQNKDTPAVGSDGVVPQAPRTYGADALSPSRR